MISRDRIAARLAKPFGEFLVIVTGVLVALAVDSWAERRSEHELEESYLVRLEEEVRQDSVRIQGMLRFMGQVDSTLVALADLRAGQAPVDPSRFLEGLILARIHGLPGSLSQTTFDDLRNAGATRLIRDPRLRFSISSYYAGIARRRTQLDAEYTSFPLMLSETLPGAVQHHVLAAYPLRGGGVPTGTNMPDALVHEALQALATSPDLDRHIRSRTGYAAVQRYFLNDTQVSADSLLAILRERQPGGI